jgi:hypothetical protein
MSEFCILIHIFRFQGECIPRARALFFVYAAQFLRLCSEVIGLPLPLEPGGTSFNTQNPIPHKSQKTKEFLETSRAEEF